MIQYVLALFSEKRLRNAKALAWAVSCLGLTALLAGCEKEIDIEVPAHTPKLTAQYSLNTSSPSQTMFIGRSQAVLASDDLWRTGLVKNASVTIADASGNVRQRFRFVPFEYNQEQGNYKPDQAFTPEPGQQYTLQVSAPNFETIEARLTQPVPVPVVSVSFQPDNRNSPFNFSGQLRIQFHDLPDQENYYRLFVQLLDDQNRLVGNVYVVDDNDDIFGEEVEKIELYKVFDDGWAKQNRITFSDKVESYTGSSTPPTQIEVTLQHITSDLYLFERSKDNYEEDNPFAEPLNLHSNIRNGYGIFGGITATKFRIRL